jgi:uncharacterized protein (TIGR02145 family)
MKPVKINRIIRSLCLLLTVAILASSPIVVKSQTQYVTSDGVVATDNSRTVITIVESDIGVELRVMMIGQVLTSGLTCPVTFDASVLTLSDETFTASVTTNFLSAVTAYVKLDPKCVSTYPAFIAMAASMSDLSPGGAPSGGKYFVSNAARSGGTGITNCINLNPGELFPVYSIYFKKNTPGLPFQKQNIGFYANSTIPRVFPSWTLIPLTIGYIAGSPAQTVEILPELFTFRSPSSVETDPVSNIATMGATLNATFSRGDFGLANDMIVSQMGSSANTGRINWDNISFNGFIYTTTDATVTINDISNQISINGTEYSFPTSATIASSGATGIAIGGITFYFVESANVSTAQTVPFTANITGLDPSETYYAWSYIRYAFETSNTYLNVGNKVTFETLTPVLDCDVMAMEDKIVDENTPGGFYTHSGTDWDAVAAAGITLDASFYQIVISGTTYTGTTLDGFVFPLGITNVTWYGEVAGQIDSCEFTVTVELLSTEVLDCSALTSPQTASSDVEGGTTYLHIGDAWDAVAMPSVILTDLTYILTGATTGTGTTTLDGVTFNIGKTIVTWIGTGTSGIMDTCEFEVIVSMTCPTTLAYEGGPYDVTSLATLCWSSNMATRNYDGGGPIAFAKPYNNSAANEAIFGLLYTWYSAVNVPEGSTTLPTPGLNGHVQGICPDGWHVPSQAEWDLLSAYSANDLKSTTLWLAPNAGTNLTGFNSLPAGMCSGATDKFIDLYGFTAYWANDADPSQYAHSFYLTYYCDIILERIMNKLDGLSVRCILDY